MPATTTDPAALHRLAATLAGLYPNRTWADAVRGAAEEIDRLRAELAAERERVAGWFAPHPGGGRWCRPADHMQGACDCEAIAAAVRGGHPA